MLDSRICSILNMVWRVVLLGFGDGNRRTEGNYRHERKYRRIAAAFLGLEFVLATARARLGDPLNTALGGGVVKPPHVTVLAFFATSEKW